jgi:hypothetical protein
VALRARLAPRENALTGAAPGQQFWVKVAAGSRPAGTKKKDAPKSASFF